MLVKKTFCRESETPDIEISLFGERKKTDGKGNYLDNNISRMFHLWVASSSAGDE